MDTDTGKQPQNAQQAAPIAAQVLPDPADVEKNKIFAIISYIGILWIVPLLAAKDSKFAMYHANQGLVLFIIEVVISFFAVIPIVGCLAGIAGLGCFVLAILGIINAVNGKMEPLPLVGEVSLIK